MKKFFLSTTSAVPYQQNKTKQNNLVYISYKQLTDIRAVCRVFRKDDVCIKHGKIG